MDGNEAQLAKIKDAIKKGELTKEIIERRLNAAIDAELRKTDSPADMELINACQDLLWEINMHGEPYHSNQQQSLAALREKLAKMERAKKRKRRVLGIAMASFLLVVGSFAVDTALHRQWLEGEQAPDEQQYIISGQENNPGLLTESQAGNEPIPYPQSITTTSLEEVVSILGYTPLMPTWLPEGWTIESYYIRMGDTSVIRIMCQNEQEEELLRLSIFVYPDMESALFAFEQERSGDEIICNGWNVYLAENYGSPVAIWQDKVTCYSITGPVSKEELLKIIRSIQRGENNT